jgi:hypothetical protein
MHISRRKLKKKPLPACRRGLSSVSEHWSWRERCVSEVLAAQLMATTAKPNPSP